MSRFDKEAKEWDKSARRRALAQTVAHHIIEIVPKKDYHVLDVGCGTGLVSYNLLPIARSITGIDTSQKMVEEFNSKSNSPDVRAFCKRLEECERHFDLIVSSMTLHHIPKTEEFFWQAKRHLHSGGYLFVADLTSEDGTFHDKGNDGVHHFGFDPKELQTITRALGFTTIFDEIVFTIQKHRPFEVFLLGLRLSA